MEEMDPNRQAEPEQAGLPQEKMSFRNKLILLALFGALLGFVVKTEAAKRFTVGFEDYKIGDSGETYDISRMEKELLKKKALMEKQRLEEEQKASDAAQKEQESPAGTSCQENTGETCKL
jgi:hypothetical protein